MTTFANWDAAARPGSRIGRAIEAHASIGSTNDRARELLRDAPDGVVVVAEEQTAGRGRRGRRWLSPSGVNLTASVGLRPLLGPASAWQLGFAAALAVRDACLPHAPVWLKWPNDLVSAGGLKVGGLLVETAIEASRLTEAVVGIGVNVNWRRTEMPPEIAARATSLGDLTGAEVDRVALLRRVLERLEAEITALEAAESPLERYRRACSSLGEEVEVETGGATLRGHARTVDASGALVVETAGGPLAISHGEVVRVRPVGASR